MKRIFAFWVNKNNKLSIPPYLDLCMETWKKSIPDLELVIINYDNLYEWIDEDYLSKKELKTLTIPQQKDAVSYALLYKHGGVFLDVDTIIFKDIYTEIEKLDDRLYLFGRHLGALICKKAGNEALLHCMNTVKKTLEKENKLKSFFTAYKIKQFLKNLMKIALGVFVIKYRGTKLRWLLPWSATGNAVINPVMRNPNFSSSVGVIDHIKTGAIIERSFFDNKGQSESDNRKQNYLDFYFEENNIKITDVIEKASFGMALLHNSWTPTGYKELDYQAIKSDKSLLSRLLMFVLEQRSIENLNV